MKIARSNVCRFGSPFSTEMASNVLGSLVNRAAPPPAAHNIEP